MVGARWPAQLAEPLHVRNLNPLVAVFGLPAWDTVPIGTRFGVTAEVANHYRFSLAGNELLMLDGETVRTNLALTHGFASGWSLGIEVPYYHVGGGVLDDVIDGWHSAFGMPDGGRNARPEGELLYRFGERARAVVLADGAAERDRRYTIEVRAADRPRPGVRRASERQAADRRRGHARRQRFAAIGR